MAKSQRKPSPPTPAELLGMRIQKVISSPSAQLARKALIFRAPHEGREDWEQLVDGLSETEGVSVSIAEDGGVNIAWVESPDY